MKSKLIVGILLLAAVVGVSQLINSSRKQNRSADFPDGMHWQCAACQHGFTIPREEYAAWVGEHDGPLPCPECGKPDTKVARRCPHRKCGEYHTTPNVVMDGVVCCPVCREPLP